MARLYTGTTLTPSHDTDGCREQNDKQPNSVVVIRLHGYRNEGFLNYIYFIKKSKIKQKSNNNNNNTNYILHNDQSFDIEQEAQVHQAAQVRHKVWRHLWYLRQFQRQWHRNNHSNDS